MAISDIRLQNFRSYADAFFELSPAVNIIVGPNASGKTNLLEAVLLLARGTSYRAKDNELVAFGEPWARLDAHIDDVEGVNVENLRTIKIERPHFDKNSHDDHAGSATAKKSFEVEGKKFLRLSQQKSLPVVLFEPNHLLLLSGSPELRRSYLDDLLEQTTPGFGTLRRQYRRVVTQRNALLKQGSTIASRQIFVWNVRLSELAGRIVRQRLQLIEDINQRASEVYGEISHTEARMELQYASTLSLQVSQAPGHYESALIHKFEHNFERDCILGFTTAGPHRDDLKVELNGHASQDTASRGEVRTIILTLKILELQLLQAARSQSPLLLLDDVFSELDGVRRRALTNFLQAYQTFITTTDADVVVKHFTNSAQLIPLSRDDSN